ncbi:UNVERIFIED_CONTAM: hypothetical protein Sradi_2093700 [Sesamum radiatum]|uniref:Integrase catalytic domain-containing protein n=1 Tax=Sesamum radiatum TaxID=300843 RepID=A0AAW2TIT9_SESRA
MILRIERQRQVHLGESLEGAVLFAEAAAKKRKDLQRGQNYRKKEMVDKRGLKCELVKTGHDKSTCFKLHGVPEWYKELNEQKKKNVGGTNRVNAMQGPEPKLQKEMQREDKPSVNDVVMELMKMLKKLPADPIQASCSEDFADSDTLLWHKRLGHPSLKVLEHIPTVKNAVKNAKSCTMCPLAKQHRLPFPYSASSSSKPFDLIHVDIWGPYHKPTLSNCHYFLTVVDDYNRATWTYLMRHKSQTPTLLKTFLKYAQNQFNSYVKNIRTDNGSEFFGRDCQSLFTSLGIFQQKSCPYTPQ